MTYFEEARESILFIDQLFYEELLEQLDVERDFMISCFENNIILEAEEPKAENKGNWIAKIKEAVKNLFNKFVNMVQDLFKADEKWINEKLPEVVNLNFNNLKVNCIPYWNIRYEDIMKILGELQRELTNVKPNDSKLSNLQSREDVENYGAFRKYKKRNKDFGESIKIRFKVGEDNEANPISLENDALKKRCISEMIPYVKAYNKTVLPQFKTAYNNFNNMLNAVERELSRDKSVNESFCLLEDCYYSDTELSMCLNYTAIFEAEGEDKEPVNKVQDTSKSENNDDNKSNDQKKDNNVVKSGSTAYNTYLKHAIQLNQLALAAAMTACEERYRAYMSILKGVHTARAPKK